ncbi:MAG: tRNA guanosine(15) transglycosylase TgtA [Candidatus Altiarchaeota archaeon]
MRTLDFEIKAKDIAARIGKLKISQKEIETPALLPVYNLNKQIISIHDLKREFKINAIMTNAYSLFKNEKFRDDVKEKGIHKFLNFSGLIATDSGSYQLMRYGFVSVSNEEILKFQEQIRVEIGSFLDIPTLPFAYKKNAEQDLTTTLERAKEAKNFDIVINAGIQGSTFLDLRKRAAKFIGKEFQLCAIGGIVKLMEDYKFSDLAKIILTVKKNIPSDRVVHAFGLGHPMLFSFAVALGCDLLDSAAYALFAQDDRYLTSEGTKKISSLEYLPCSCKVCENFNAKEIREMEKNKRETELAKHNLYVTLEEIKKIKQAIKEQALWEFLEIRARAHPELFLCLKEIQRHKKFLAKLDMITKKQGFYFLSNESKNRTEIVNAKERIKRINSKNSVELKPFGRVPIEILEIYPFNSLMPKEEKIKIDEIQKIRQIMNYQFGINAENTLPEKFHVKKSRKTLRARAIYYGREMIASIRASDHFIIPHKFLAEKLHEKFPYPNLRVVIHDDAVQFVKQGKSVFAKFVLDIDKNLRAGDEVLIVDKKDNLLRTGTLLLSPIEAKTFKRGVAVRVR